MIKFKRGGVTNTQTGVTKDIVVKAATPNTIGDMVIGGGLVLAGIAYLTMTAFKNGAIQFENAELKALAEAGLLDVTNDTNN